MEQPVKKKRGRPRKNVEVQKTKKKKKVDVKDDNIILFLALSEGSDDENAFTTNDTEADPNKITMDSLSETGSDSSDSYFGKNSNDVAVLIDEIKKRDKIISELKKNGKGITRGGKRSTYSAYSAHSARLSSNYNSFDYNYHSTIIVDSTTQKNIVPSKTDVECWWCDHQFDTMPVYIPNFYRNGKFYVFGNFCSFNCARTYNNKMLKDYKCKTRFALLQTLKNKITGSDHPIKYAPRREILQKKGGKYSIKKFRNGFIKPTANVRMNMPQLVPLCS